MNAAAARLPVVVDVDTGIDDALALLWLARSPRVDLLAVSCVAGNAHVDQVVSNTLEVLDIAGRADVCVGRGAVRPLIERPRAATAFHGEDGLGNLLPGRAHRSVDDTALEVLHRALRSSPIPVTVIGLAPLTNIALLLSVYPEAAANIERIVFMGGAIGMGNATATAEFNAWHDPESLAIVLASGVPVTMYGLDVFLTARVDDHQRRQLAEGVHASGPFAAVLLRYLEQQYSEDGSGEHPTLGDGGAAIVAVLPELAVSANYPVSVVLSGQARGQTTVDQRILPGEDAHHGELLDSTLTEVVLSITPGVVAAFVETLTAP